MSTTSIDGFVTTEALARQFAEAFLGTDPERSYCLTDVTNNVVFVSPRFSEATGLGAHVGVALPKESPLHFSSVRSRRLPEGILHRPISVGSSTFHLYSASTNLPGPPATALLTPICHELSNPLQSIRALTELALLDSCHPGVQENLQVILHESRRLSTLVANLRKATRHSAESEAPSLMNLGSIAAHVVKLRSPQLSEANIHVRTDLDRRDTFIRGDRGQIEQIMLNLLTNAEHALSDNPDPRILHLSTTFENGNAVFRVMDNGAGIQPENLDRVFDAHWSTKSQANGTGIGRRSHGSMRCSTAEASMFQASSGKELLSH